MRKSVIFSKLLGAVMGLGLLVSSAGASAQYWTGYVGGGGGGYYEHNCGSVPVTSFGVYSGDLIDALQVRCWNGHTSPYFGGPGGSFSNLGCAISTDYNRAMRGVQLYNTWVLTAIQGFCESMASNGTHNTAWVGNRTGTYSSLRCPQYDAIKRVRGGAGLFVDSISVYCGDY